MPHSPLQLAAQRTASAVLRRLRRYQDRLTAPDPFAPQVAAALRSAAATRLDGSVVLVTGSSRGVGHALAEALLEAGARVVINGRDAERLERARLSLGRDDTTLLAMAADAATNAGAQRLLDQTQAHFGRIDVLINCAAIAGPVGLPGWEVTPAQFEAVQRANLDGPFLMARAALARMLADGRGGRIINVSSGAGRLAAPGVAPYVASKFGLEGLTHALALDAWPHGVAVCAIELPTLRTEMAHAVVRFEDREQLPPPQTVAPAFLALLRAPAGQVSDRVFAAWRLAADAEAELALARPLASFARFAFEPPRCNGQPLRRGDPGVQAFDRAENPLGMPGTVRRLLQQESLSADYSRYPSERQGALRSALAARLKLPEDDFCFGAGSAELVERCVRTFVAPGDKVVCNDPSWFMFDRWAAMAEAQVHRVPVLPGSGDAPFDHHLQALAAAVDARTRLVYLVSPGNPLGQVLQRRAFEDFLAAVPPHVPVVVDEAYIEFADDPQALRCHELVPHTDRLLIGLRTFSKFYGLAGLRVGYAFGTQAAMRLLGRLEQLFCVGALSERAALAALEDEVHAQATRHLVASEKSRMRARLAAAGLAAVPSQTHFMLVECPLPAAQAELLWQAFLSRGLLLPRGIVNDRWLLLPVLQRADNDRHLDILLDFAARGQRAREAQAA